MPLTEKIDDNLLPMKVLDMLKDDLIRHETCLYYVEEYQDQFSDEHYAIAKSLHTVRIDLLRKYIHLFEIALANSMKVAAFTMSTIN